jgi:hypothetical protein
MEEEKNTFVTAMMQTNNENATTWNGAKSYATTATVNQNGALVNYLFKALRDTPDEQQVKLWVEAKSEDANAAKLLAFFTRDRFKGKGERKPFQTMLKHEVEHGNLADVERWYPLISYFGYPKDLLCLAGTKAEHSMLTFFCKVLVEDERRAREMKPVTTFGKYAPTEGGEHDKKFQLVGKMCKILSGLIGKECSKKNYRQTITALRAYMKVPERLMCLNLWHTINFSGVPSRCMHNNKKAFEKHAPTEWAEYVKKLASGETKVNSNLFPHDLAGKILRGGGFDQVAQSQWETMQAKAKAEFKEFDMTGILVVADTSGSMSSTIGKTQTRCIDVSVGLGLFFAEMLNGPFKDCIITFSETPQFHKAVGTNLVERLRSISSAHWGMSTDYQKVHRMVLETATRNKVPREHMPAIILTVSDMQFDPLWCGRTNFDGVKTLYAQSCAPDGRPYDMPQMLFWNVNGATSDYPAQADSANVGLLSGFSPTILRLVFTGELNPVQIVRRAIADPCYDVVIQPEPVDWKRYLYADFEKSQTDQDEAAVESAEKKLKTVYL